METFARHRMQRRGSRFYKYFSFSKSLSMWMPIIWKSFLNLCTTLYIFGPAFSQLGPMHVAQSRFLFDLKKSAWFVCFYFGFLHLRTSDPKLLRTNRGNRMTFQMFRYCRFCIVCQWKFNFTCTTAIWIVLTKHWRQTTLIFQWICECEFLFYIGI